jgi:hypothetical protein
MNRFVHSNRQVKNDYLFIIAIFSTLIFSSATISNYSHSGVTNVVYGQSDIDQANSTNTTNLVNLQDIPLEKVHVGDIEVAHKTFGEGDPIILISPSQGDMNAWEPSLLDTLSANHKVIVFDNRGVGSSSTGIKPFSVQQFANDTAGLMDILKVQNALFLDTL